MSQVYVISLLRSEARRQTISRELQKQGIAFEFFDAIDGKNGLPMLAQDYDYSKRLWLTSGKMPNSGEVGCYASHFTLWLKCIELDKPIIIFEDDIELNEGAQKIIALALEKVMQYDFLRLESILPDCASEIVENEQDHQISLLKNNYGLAAAYAISPRAAAKFIKHRWSMPVDCFIGANYIHKQLSYQLTPYLRKDNINIHKTTIQDEAVPDTPIYRKASRECYSLYKKIRLHIAFIKSKHFKS
ncbi:MAG: glycosyltransferase family 25 protein [Vibrionaceae bacterium]